MENRVADPIDPLLPQYLVWDPMFPHLCHCRAVGPKPHHPHHHLEWDPMLPHFDCPHFRDLGRDPLALHTPDPLLPHSQK